MPKSKREKVVHLTRTQKHVRDRKEKLVSAIHTSFEEFNSVYVFEYGNLRTQYLKDIRSIWNSSRFFLGKNKVMQRALGKSKTDETRKGTFSLVQHLEGQRGLLFTNQTEEEVSKYFRDYSSVDFARAGAKATDDFILRAGPIEGPSSMEIQFRNLGLPTELKDGVIMLREDIKVCSTGDVLTVEQARILKHFDVKMETFRLKLICKWEKGEFKVFH
eukprot:c2367_g1_i1.p1 GENE.c2367_g1_i1~~c2367_g1_i1.p1  ORF type:complete len:217 (-),score=75.59 c2367_g1_i1:14-664(-)